MTDIREGVATVTIGRTAPIPAGPQPAEKSLPAVFATDQPPLPVVEVNKVLSEVQLSLLGVNRVETALGLFSDVTTYDANPNEWGALIRNLPADNSVVLASTASNTAFTHIPAESAGVITSSAATSSTEFGILSSKRFFRYQPGRVSSGTFGVKITVSDNSTDVKKWGVFDRFDGYYFEVQGGSQQIRDFNFFTVRRSSAFSSAVNPLAGESGTAGVDLQISRDGLQYVHAGLFDKSLRVSTGGTLITGPAFSFRVATEFRFVYEYRVPRRYFSYDRMDALQAQTPFYSDVVPGGTPFTFSISGSADFPIVSYSNGTPVPNKTLNSVWNLDFTRVTMYKVEFSWYGAVGATFLAYVPDLNSAGDARWVRINSMRCSNQSRLASLGNAFLPMSYYASRGGATTSQVFKYGASFYIDGGDKGTIVARSFANNGNVSVAAATVLLGLRVRTLINNVRNRMQVYPIALSLGTSGLVRVELIKNPTLGGTTPTWASQGTLSPIEATTTAGITLTGGTVLDTFWISSADTIKLDHLFAFNKDYLSFPLAATVGDTLFIRVTNISGTQTVNGGISWEEQS